MVVLGSTLVAAGMPFAGLEVDGGILLALLLQVLGIVWWGSRMQARQDADRDMHRAEFKQATKDLADVNARLTHIEQYGSVEVRHVLEEVRALAATTSDIQQRVTRVEAMCSLRHNPPREV